MKRTSISRRPKDLRSASLSFTKSCCHASCQEIGLVALMFFFELLFSNVSLAISLYVSLTDLFLIVLFPICQLPETLKTKEKQDFDSTDTGNSLKVILRLKNLSRFLNQPVDPLVDLHQSLHSNSASTTSISPTILTTGASSILSTPRAPKKASPSSSERPILKWIANPDSKL